MPVQERGQLLRRALHFRQRGGAAEDGCAAAHDLQVDAGRWIGGSGADQDRRAERAAPVVDLGLRQVERIFAFDVAGAHVVADRVAKDAPAAVDRQGQFRLRRVPGGVRADAHRAAGGGGGARAPLVEQLRPLGGVDAVVEAAAPRLLRFGHACVAAAVVGDAGAPDLLADHRRQRFLAGPVRRGFRRRQPPLQVRRRVVLAEQLVPVVTGQQQPLPVPLDHRAGPCPVDLHGRQADRKRTATVKAAVQPAVRRVPSRTP